MDATHLKPRKGEDVNLKTVVEIIQTEDATTRTMQSFNSTTTATTTANVHYVKYDKKKKSSRNFNSNIERKCYRCGLSFEKEHMKNCPAKDPECRFCGVTGHFARCCGKARKFTKGHRAQDTSKKEDSTTKKNLHAIQAIQENSSSIEYWDEDGNLRVQEILEEK